MDEHRFGDRVWRIQGGEERVRTITYTFLSATDANVMFFSRDAGVRKMMKLEGDVVFCLWWNGWKSSSLQLEECI